MPKARAIEVEARFLSPSPTSSNGGKKKQAEEQDGKGGGGCMWCERTKMAAQERARGEEKGSGEERQV